RPNAKRICLAKSWNAPLGLFPDKNGGFSRNIEPVSARIALRLASKMRGHFRVAALWPTQPVGEINREGFNVRDDARECPLRKRDRMWTRRRRETAKHDVNARHLVLAVPRCWKTAGEAHPMRPMLCRHDPNHGMACPGAAALEERVRLLERRSDVSGENGVMPAERNVGRLPARGNDARRVFQLREPSTHARCGLDRGPSTIRRAQRLSELAAAGADIEQVADIAHALTDEWRNSTDVVGNIDGRGVEFDWINGLRRAGKASRRLQRNGWPTSSCVMTRGD